MESVAGFEETLPASENTPPTPLFAAIPQAPARGMIVLHEIFGRQPEIDRVVLQFARRGYAAAAPELLDGFKPLCIRRVVRAMATGEGAPLEQVQAARRWLCARANLPENKVGLIGFCLGGGLAVVAGRGWGAVSINYGQAPRENLLRDSAPLIACYGGRDNLFGKEGRKLQERAGPLGVEVELHEYPTVGHSFLTDGHHPLGFFLSRPFMHCEARDPAVSAEAWSRILDFFERRL